MTDEWYDPSIPVQSLGTARYVFQRFTKATEELVYRSASRIIVVSRHLQRRLVSHAAKTIRCPMAFDPRVFQQAEPTRLAPADQFVVLYAGSVSRIEGIDLLLGAMRRLRPPEGRPARLFVVGNPAHSETIDQYKTAAGELLAGGLVTFAPAVDRERYASLLRGADLLVIPRPTSVASQAGFPYKLVEYIASGVPVLVTRFGDVEEYFANDVHCLMVDPNDPGPLAAGIELAMRHPDRMGMLARQGQARVQELFSFDTVAAQLRQLIESAAATTRQ